MENQDRIQINGVWYVREVDVSEQVDFTDVKSFVVEDYNYMFDVSVLCHEFGEEVDMWSVEYYDKIRDEKHFWDNGDFFIEMLEDSSKLSQFYNEQGFDKITGQVFLACLKRSVKLGWLKK